jgi:hypothetical protein
MFKTLKELIGTKFPPNYLSRGDRQYIEAIIIEASEQAFNAGRAYYKWSLDTIIQVEIDKSQPKYIYPRFIDFKLDKL